MHKTMMTGLFWVSLVIAPLILAGMELFHPAGFTASPGMFAYLCKPQPYAPEHWALAYFGPQWWFALHIVQLPLLGLVSVGLWNLVSSVEDGLAGVLAWLSRFATFVFLIAYTALDAIGGIGLGRSILNLEAMKAAGQVTQAQYEGAVHLLNTNWVDGWIGGVGSVISLTGSWAIFVAALTAALALLMTKRAPWPALVLLTLFGWEIQTSHASPHGPIGFTLLAIAGIWIGVSRIKTHKQMHGRAALA